jgi:hypothetical protein
VRYVNRQIYASEAVEWFDQFTRLETWNRDRQQRLRDLGPEPKPEDVDAIMGGPWTAVQCSECGNHRDSGIELDTCDTEDGKPVVLCLACLHKVDGLFEKNEAW